MEYTFMGAPVNLAARLEKLAGPGEIVFSFDPEREGGGGYGLVSKIKAPENGKNGETLYYQMGYGGLVLEYVNNSRQLTHYTFSTLIGAGGLSYTYKMGKGDWPFDYAEDTFFIIEPEINVELNVSSHFRVGLGVGYRWISGLDLKGITDQDLSGVSANLTFKFGSF